jgi:glycosyltransferase involved in cell wall biosynthesis
VKVLLVTPEYPPDTGGGISAYYRDLVPALRRLGCEVTVLKGSAFVHGGAPYQHDTVNVSVLETARFEKWLSHFSHFAMFPELRRHLAAGFALHEQARQGEELDVVEVTDWGMLFLPWMIAADAPVLVQLHGSTGQILLHEPMAGREAEGVVSLLLEKTALAESTGLASYSHANARWWEQVVKHSVAYQPPPLRLGETLDESSEVGDEWLALGRIQHWKGPQVACAAWEVLAEQAPVLEWAGRDTFHGASRQSTSTWLKTAFPGTWGRTIRPIGQLSPLDVTRRLRAARAVLVPSTWDVFNLATAEAMALGKAVVVSTGAGAVDLVQHGMNGFVFENGDTAALAALVRQIERMNTAELRTIGQAAAQTVRDRLDPSRIANARIALYRELQTREATKNVWLRDWLSPAANRAPLDFLDALPLNDLSRYVARRTARKVLRTGRRA